MPEQSEIAPDVPTSELSTDPAAGSSVVDNPTSSSGATAEQTSPSSPTTKSGTTPSSPKPAPIVTDPSELAASPRNSHVLPDTSLMATTPAAMETAMRFETEETRKSTQISPETAPVATGNISESPITAAPAASSPNGSPGIVITLLILSGARSTFTLNKEFMQKHNVSYTDPMQMTVYSLKECVWRDWKEDELNTQQPSSPHLIRLILLGRLLEDKSLLKDCRLNPETPNVVHLSLRPADVSEDEVTTKAGKFSNFPGSSGRGGDRPSPSCRCVIL